MKYTPDHIILRLCESNDHKPDYYRPKHDNGNCRTSMNCGGISCLSCPFRAGNNKDKTLTMGDLRAELGRRRALKSATKGVTESHKGGGAGIYVTGKSEPIEFLKTSTGFGTDVDTAVYHPKHYEVIDEVEAIQVIARSMTVEQFKGYCLGNILKYRLRLGAKDAVEQDLKKAQNYKDIFEKFKGLCHDAAK
ncbi:nucleotide kinase [Morganella phage phiA020]